MAVVPTHVISRKGHDRFADTLFSRDDGLLCRVPPYDDELDVDEDGYIELGRASLLRRFPLLRESTDVLEFLSHVDARERVERSA